MIIEREREQENDEKMLKMIELSNFEDVEDMLDLQTSNRKSCLKVWSYKVTACIYPTTRSHEMYMTWVMKAASKVLSLHKSGAPAELRIPRTTCFQNETLFKKTYIISSYHSIFLNSKTSCKKTNLPRQSRFDDSHPLSLLTWSAIGFRSPCNSGRKISAPAAPAQWEINGIDFCVLSVFCGKCKGIYKELQSKRKLPNSLLH